VYQRGTAGLFPGVRLTRRPAERTDPNQEKPMRLQPGLHRAVSSDRPSVHRRTAVLPGRPLPWRPPIRLVGLLELLHRRPVRFA
jgi:hypothetical protein